MDLVVAGQIDEGVAELEIAYEILPHPNVLYNIGRAYAEVGRYEEARDYFDRYLETDPPDREEVRAIVSAINERIAVRAEAAAAAQTPTEPTETEPQVAVERTLAATEEQLAILDATIAQIDALCQSTGATSFCERSRSLRTLREDLARGSAPSTETIATTSTETQPVCEGEDCPETETPISAEAGGFDVGASSSGEAAYVEQVDAAARRRSSPLDAPASTTIITRQDIRLSGITSLAELLRRAAGVNVMNVTPGGAQVAIRGFNRLLSPRVLMLVNGRTTYLDALGAPFWDAQPFLVEDIERIEVIRGPASVLYGANGMSGIVNIVLRTPGEEPGTTLSVGVGNGDQYRAHASTSGRAGDLSYRFNGGFAQQDRFEALYSADRRDLDVAVRDPGFAYRNSMFAAQLRYRASDDVALVAEGGVNYLTPINVYATGAFLDLYATGPSSFISASMLSPYGRIRTFYNRWNTALVLPDNSIPKASLESNTFDVEAEFARSFHWLVDHDFHLGVNYRLKRVEWGYLDQPWTEHHFGVFLEETMQIGRYLRLVGAVRMDRHPRLSNPVFSPRGAILVRPTESQTIRLSAGTAFRMPAIMDTYLDIRRPTFLNAASSPALGLYLANRDFGRPAIQPERIRSFELGYLNQENDYFSVDMAAYYNRVTGILGLSDSAERLTIADYAGLGINAGVAGFDPVSNSFTAALTTFANESAVYHVLGGEAGVRVFPVDGLDVYANYALNVSRVVDSPFDQKWDRRTSLHTVNLGAQYRSDVGIDVSSDFHYASSVRYPEIMPTASGIERHLVPLPSYYLLNARLAYHVPGDRFEVAVAGSNITNAQRRQYVFGQQVEARVIATLSARF